MAKSNAKTASASVETIADVMAHDIQWLVKGCFDLEGGDAPGAAKRKRVRQKDGSSVITYRYKTGEVIRVTVEQVK
jgi:hypothetical protein